MHQSHNHGELCRSARDDDMLRFSAMSAVRLDSVHSISIDPDVIATTLRVLQHFGAHECEGLVLWIGEVAHSHARITRAVVPDQRPIKSEEGVGYFVDGGALFDLNRKLADTGLRLIAQVHSHPGEAYHSKADDRYAIVTADGGLSLVVPNFGKAPADPTLWAVYRLSNGCWHELDVVQARSLLNVGAAAWAFKHSVYEISVDTGM
jgi:proteasome lid subunit RPN8/RPN11